MATLPWRHWTLVRKGVVVIGASVLMLIGSLITGYRLESETREATAEMLRTMKVQSDIQTLLTLIEDAATGVRGFVLTGEHDFLTPYENARQQLPPTLDALRSNVRDPEQSARLQRVIPLVANKLSSLDTLSDMSGDTTARLRDHLMASKQILDQLRAEIRAMNTREEVLVQARTHAVDQAIRRNTLMTAATALVGLLGAAAMLIFTIRVVRRVRRAAHNAERLALEQPLLPGDPATDELGQLSDRLERASVVLAERATAAQAANRAKTEFLSRTSHELRTPLNAILGFAQLLEDDLRDPRQQQEAAHITRAGRHLLALIDDVLDIARIEAGGMTLESEPVELDPLLAEALALVAPLAAKRRIRLQGSPSSMQGIAILGDRQRALQVVLNLLSNAIKYNVDDGWVQIAASGDEQHVTIDVTDGGAGIPVEMRDRLFTPFDRLGAERRDRNGAGLGLALSKNLMEQMGGWLRFEPGEPEGSRFSLTFPRAVTHVPPQVATTATAVKIRANQSDERTVLCVEDDPSNLALIETLMLRRPNLRFLAAGDVAEALHVIDSTSPDLVLLDLNLPDGSGEAVLRAIRTSPTLGAIPVVILSADALPETVDRLRATGASAHLTKPLDLKAFYAILDGALP